MSIQHLQGEAVSSASLVRVIETKGFQSYIKLGRPNDDESHRHILKNCTATNDTNKAMLDSLFGIEKLSDFLASGGRLLPNN